MRLLTKSLSIANVLQGVGENPVDAHYYEGNSRKDPRQVHLVTT